MLYYLFGKAIPLATILGWTSYLFLSLFPLSIFVSMRWFGFARLPAALAGLVASLTATPALYGFDFESYVWAGYGLYTQLVGMILLPLALAAGYRALRDGRGYLRAVALLAATILAHLVFGYMAILSLGLFALLPALDLRRAADLRAILWPCWRRLALLLALTGLVTAYFLVPFALDGRYMNRSVWEQQTKYDSYGAAWVLGRLVRGELFDEGRLPILTLLAAGGLALCLRRWRDDRHRLPAALALCWLLLFFGRPTWGALLNLLPLSHDLHLHRLIAGVHLGGIYLAGVGLALPWQWVAARHPARYLLPVAALTALVLAPVYVERAAYLSSNGRFKATSQAAFAAERADLIALVATLRQAPPGRVYAGLSGNWGGRYRVGAVPVYAVLQQAGFDSVSYLYHALSLNAEVLALFDERRLDQYVLFNVRYIVAPANQPVPQFAQPLGTFGRHRLYGVVTTGYFDLGDTGATFSGEKRDFSAAASRWLNSGLPAAGEYPAILLADETEASQTRYLLSQAATVIPQLPPPPTAPRGRVLSEAVEGNGYRATVEANRASTLVLKVTYHPGWHATVDGADAPTMMVMPSYVGIRVGPGTHQVRLEYRPPPLRRVLLVVGVLTLGLVRGWEWRRDRAARRVRQPAVEQHP